MVFLQKGTLLNQWRFNSTLWRAAHSCIHVPGLQVCGAAPMSKNIFLEFLFTPRGFCHVGANVVTPLRRSFHFLLLVPIPLIQTLFAKTSSSRSILYCDAWLCKRHYRNASQSCYQLGRRLPKCKNGLEGQYKPPIHTDVL